MKAFVQIVLYVLLIQDGFSQITYDNVFVDYDSAWQFKNLKLIPIRSKGAGIGRVRSDMISLKDGLRSGLVSISERGTASTENVHWLRVNNNTNKPVFIGSGEILVGGRQDRMVTKDTVLLPAGKDQYISVMCVEEGRWSDKEKKFVYAGYANPRLRKVLDQSKNQVKIWREISNQLDTAKISSPTLAYAAPHPDKKIPLLRDEYTNYFLQKFKSADSTIVGFVCISGKKIIGSDVFAANNLFYNSLEALLPGYIEEAMRFGRSPDVVDRTVKTYLDQFLVDEKTQEQYLRKNGKIYRFNEKVLHLTAY